MAGFDCILVKSFNESLCVAINVLLFEFPLNRDQSFWAWAFLKQGVIFHWYHPGSVLSREGTKKTVH